MDYVIDLVSHLLWDGEARIQGTNEGGMRNGKHEAQMRTNGKREARMRVVSCPAAPPTYGKVRLVTIDAFLGPSAPKWGWPIRVERNDVITLFDGGTMDSLWALTS